MSDINKHVVSMKRKMTAIIGSTMCAFAGGTLPAIATITNTNGQHQMIAKKLPQAMVSYLTRWQEEMTVALGTTTRGVGPSTGRRQPR